ncbi:hypothetical protein [Acetobacter orleanensis]|uniref:Uncharacterized protein n=1 Tax=Acetobacter orleanensis TaxID=104099 RepID=A0A4Y3TIP7_9PROT|nr:hypothetical protein [Acetobacter orleanensis]KXV63949.1 hypothetical protein AD949_06515 [Acetobacter orleanensis]PCD79721.1 hypothetical protein CO710_05835 [Acetobacter orleanensis]GAN69288.1 hypothetical protein Abol_030_053 [Acetobacter orleanensis JCM 7639]GBR28295.1 hypothetical protein AA0473_1702 [Acetobacter orleanensis NRIC 0473]GEB82186.1 hypothetical protein AOR01nite_06630 [Acetobacter orleanensis]
MKTLDYTHTKDGADHGKRFVLTRMDAFSADKWARHILQAAIRGGARVGADLAEAGVAGLASLGIEIFGFMEESDLDRALERLMQCVALRPDLAYPDTTRAVITADFEEPETLGLVRAEAFRLHVGFLLAAAHQLFPVVAALLGDTAQEAPSPPAA